VPSDIILKIFAIFPEHIHVILIVLITVFVNLPVGVIDMQRVLCKIFNEFLNVIDVYCDSVPTFQNARLALEYHTLRRYKGRIRCPSYLERYFEQPFADALLNLFPPNSINNKR
jgi:hypothetical protein